MRVKHYGRFVQGELHANTFTAALRAFGDRGVPVVLTVEEDKGKRSSQANRYYWGVVVELIALGLLDCGWEPRECSPPAVHDLLKREYLSEQKHAKDGVLLNRVKSTTELSKEEFGAYVEHCQRFAAENLGVVIPSPGEQLEIV